MTATKEHNSLYNVLGVRRDASKEDIRKAYRRLVKTCHPDIAPGQETLFELVSLAHNTLTDEDARKTYDLTGEIDRNSVDRLITEATKFVVTRFEEYILKYSGSYNPLKYIQTQAVVDARHSLNAAVRNAEDILRKYQEAKEHLKYKGDPAGDVITKMLDTGIARHQQLIESVRGEHKILDKVEAILEDYEYDIPPPKILSWQECINATNATTTGTGTGF
jgi:curved DNA-binding protein CbpA